MLIRYRHWATDGLPVHTKQLGLSRLIFDDAQQGILDVRSKTHIDALLRDTSHAYEIAYEVYGVFFDAQGQEITLDEPLVTVSESFAIQNPVTYSDTVTNAEPTKPKGRKKKA